MFDLFASLIITIFFSRHFVFEDGCRLIGYDEKEILINVDLNHSQVSRHNY